MLIVLAAAVALVFSGALSHLSLSELRHRRAALLALVHAHPARSLMLYLAADVVVIALSLPGALIMTLTAGFLFGPVIGGVAAMAGVTGGAVIMFLVVRFTFGEAIADWTAPGGLTRRLAAEVRRNAFSYLLTLRLTPAAPIALVNIVAGLAQAPLPVFLAATVLGVIPSSAIYASIGASLGEVFNRPGPLDLRTVIRPELIAPLFGLAALSLAPHLLRFRQMRTAAAKSGGIAETGPLK